AAIAARMRRVRVPSDMLAQMVEQVREPVRHVHGVLVQVMEVLCYSDDTDESDDPRNHDLADRVTFAGDGHDLGTVRADIESLITATGVHVQCGVPADRTRWWRHGRVAGRQ